VSSSNVDTIRGCYEAFARGDGEAAVAPFAEDIEWTEAAGFPTAGTYHGVPAVVENVFGPILSDWDGFRIEIERLLDAGDSVVMVGTYRGTWRATGKAMSARAVHVWDLRDGKAIRFEQFVDTLEVAEALEA
jgi:ketosteroid isomerase-like protein